MCRKVLSSSVFFTMLVLGAPWVHGKSVKLHSVEFPEKRVAYVSFSATPSAPTARLAAEVTRRRGQAWIELAYDHMKPAILFGGDVTCYVLWAVTRDGQYENLGEMLTHRTSGRLTFSTGKKSFAMMVTAESFYLVSQPSELVVFHNRGSSSAEAPSKPFQFTNFVAAPRHNMDAIAHIKWDSKVPLELLQARKAFELATENDARTHAAQIHADASKALDAANKWAAESPKSRELLDTARRAVALSNEALNISRRRIEAIEMERRFEERRQEIAALEQRAAEAEATVEEAQRLAERAREESERIRQERERMFAETSALRNEKASLEGNMQGLRQESERLLREKSVLEQESEKLRQEKIALQRDSQRLIQEKVALEKDSQRLLEEKSSLQKDSERLKKEKSELNSRLQAALSHVAETKDSVRGFVVNLPDILFDLNQATLKPEAQLVLAKLSGILLIMPDQTALIEGHTDSTGSADYNLDLSQRRAMGVLHFLQAQGLEARRLRAVGYGMQRPVADNSSASGRKRNRRVEIVISETAADGGGARRAGGP